MRHGLAALVCKCLGLSAAVQVIATPIGFPTSGNGLWYTKPGVQWVVDFLPIGNGYLAAMTPGGTVQETTQLNIESLWSGGPFADPMYNGGNMNASETPSLALDMQTYRSAIFGSRNGTINDVNELTTDAGAYGSYSSAGYLVSTLLDVPDAAISDYGRYLDLDTGRAVATWNQGSVAYTRESFCSNPAKACLQQTSVSTSTFSQTFAFSSVPGLPTPNITCLNDFTLMLTGIVSDPGMAYEILASVRTTDGVVSCSALASSNATLTVHNASSAFITWVGGTNYNMDAGDAVHEYSFRGPDPHDSLLSLLQATSPQSYSELRSAHETDFKEALASKFALNIGQKPDFKNPTDVLREQYSVDVGNPYLEWLLFNYGRYMSVSSARGLLPTNLLGKWADQASNPWSADYHANINLQMNYWIAETTNLDVTQGLFNYIEKTWAPRGAYTAQVLYNISQGWVTHDEMNIFGHTGMKAGGDTAQWADYPESNVWMMMHAWDHFDYTNDVSWWKSQGYPLLKSVAQFHLQKLIADEHFNDGTLVVAPCNSPEQPPVTFACSHAQQLLWQLFNAIEKGFDASEDEDSAFLNEVTNVKAKMDKGIHIGSWQQLQEWKVDMDQQNDTHRHLSHLVGLYPGYAIVNYDTSSQGGFVDYTREQVLQASEVSLIHRGNGTGPDADAGWEKVWRAACWAQLGNATEFYHELTYALATNFAPNLFSVYNAYLPNNPGTIFQIDANLGFPAAVMNALIQAPDVPNMSTPVTVTLLPALPSAWSSGSIRGARVRGGITVDLAWENGRLTSATFTVDKSAISRPVKVVYRGSIKSSFTTSAGSVKTLSF